MQKFVIFSVAKIFLKLFNHYKNIKNIIYLIMQKNYANYANYAKKLNEAILIEKNSRNSKMYDATIIRFEYRTRSSISRRIRKRLHAREKAGIQCRL